MDTTVIIIIAVIVVIIIAVVALIALSSNEKGKKDGNIENSDNPEQKENVTAKRFQQVLSDESISNKMNEEAGEILTKYTSGSGEGIPEVEKLLEGDPNNVDNENQHYYLANSYYKKGMMSDAKKEWSEVIRLNPSSKIAKNAQERIDYLTAQGK